MRSVGVDGQIFWLYHDVVTNGLVSFQLLLLQKGCQQFCQYYLLSLESEVPASLHGERQYLLH